MPHGRRIYATASDMDMATMCAYPPFQHTLPHWKFVLCFFPNLPRIDLPVQSSDRHRLKTFPPICFHIYHLISRFTVHGRCPMEKNKILLVFTKFRLCSICKTIHQKRACYYGDIFFCILNSLFFRHTKSSVSYFTRTHYMD